MSNKEEVSIKGKKILIMGGQALSIDIVNEAKSMGVYTIVTDWYPESRSPAKKIADKSFMVSTADVDAVVKLIEDEEIDGVLTGFTDSTLQYYQRVCEKANVPCYITQKQIDITTHKVKFKTLCNKFQVPVVEEYKIENDLNPGHLKKIKYPVIVKPVDNSGARGISICNNENELINAYKNALDFSESKTVIVERYMTSKEATIFYVLRNGDIYLTAIGNRHTKHNQEGVIPLPVAYSFPSQNVKKYQEELNDRVIDMFKSIGMQNGMVFIQTFIEDGEFIFYEMGYRLTGSLEYKILDVIGGLNPLKMMIKYAVSGDMGSGEILKNFNPNFNNFACNITLLGKPGQIGNITGIDKVKNIPGVIDAFPSYKEGDTIPESAIGTLMQVVARVFAIAKSKDGLSELMKQIHEEIQVTSIDGSNMLLDKFNIEELTNE